MTRDDTLTGAFTRAECKALGEAVAAALKPVADRFGLEVAVGGGTFDETFFKPRVAFRTRTAAVDTWARYAPSFGLPIDGVGKIVTLALGGVPKSYRIAGIKIESRRFPVLVERVGDGRPFRCTAAGVIKALAIAPRRACEAFALGARDRCAGCGQPESAHQQE